MLTEVFYMLGPNTEEAKSVMELVHAGGLAVWWFDTGTLARAFALMEQYADHPMDLADASLVAAAESLSTRKVFTLDRNDFASYRVRRGHRNLSFEIIGS